jgi:hypothetical protein
MVWAAESPQAANEAFNITNGDVFDWSNMWPALAETLGVQTGPDTPMSVAAYLEKNADVWRYIAAKHGLRDEVVDSQRRRAGGVEGGSGKQRFRFFELAA